MPGTRRLLAAFAAIACLLGTVGPVAAQQCLLANPSFEMPGSSGNTFAGWNQFGPVGYSTSPVPAHGARAARVTGAHAGGWDVSGYWQSLPCTAGQRWNTSVVVMNSGAAPLSGSSAALLNIEWRDGAGNLISYESHNAATPATPTDVWRAYSVQSGAAPTGTASIHFVLGVLQGPTDPTPQVSFDLASCVTAGPPTIDSLQWSDFASGRTLTFSGRTWRVKGTGYYGPGPNLFDGSASGTWVDAQGRLHLTIHKIGSNWYSSEVALVQPLGYGDYVFTTRGRLDQLDKNSVLGMFLWQYGPCYDPAFLWWNPYNEIDIEFGRWGSALNGDAQFVAQPASNAGNIFRFDATMSDSELTSHAMRWLPGRVDYRSWRGDANAESPATMIASWTYTGANLPVPDQPRVHLNLWQLAAPTVAQEVVFDAMTFRPGCSWGDCGVLAVEGPPEPRAGTLESAAPNPFAATTAFRFALARPGFVELSVFDLSGRRVRLLVNAVTAAGAHAVAWDAHDDAGRRVSPGVYLYRLRTGGATEAKRVVVLR